MFDSGVFSPFLGLSTNAQALNFHAMLSSPGLHGGWWPSSLHSLWGRVLQAPAVLQPDCWVLGAAVGGVHQFLALDLS